MEGWIVAAAVRPRVLERAGRLQFVKVPLGWGTALVCTNTTALVLREVFKSIPTEPGAHAGRLSLGSGITPFVPAATSTADFLIPCSTETHGQFLRQEYEFADSLPRFLPWSLSLQCTVGGFRFAFPIPLHLRG